MKNRSLFPQSFCAQFVCGLVLAFITLGLTSCGVRYYKFPDYTFANRPVPPSKLSTRVLVSISTNSATTGALQILDAQRDIRNSIFNPNSTFTISGFSGGYPSTIFNFPEQVLGYVYASTDGNSSLTAGTLTKVNYGTEAVAGSGGALPANADSIAVPVNFQHVYAAVSSLGVLTVIDNTNGQTYYLNLPNVYRVAVNQGDSVVLAMVRNSNTLYRLLRLNQNQGAIPGAADCQPYNVPVWCVVPVPDSSTKPSLDRPVGAYFSLDGTTAYVLNCGQECGGNASSITMMPQGSLRVDNYPTTTPYPSPVTGSIPVPGGATVSLADGTTLYVAGQQLQPDGLFAGVLSTIDLNSNTVTGQYSISDGSHTKMLLGDDNTLWIGSQSCASGERAARATAELAAGQSTDASANYNCLTRFDTSAHSAAVVPAVTQVPSGSTGSPVTVPYPNANENKYYYGDLTGLCWVQGLHKMYTAYGGQVHAFNTADGSEINNSQITVQGTALDVAFMDAATNSAN